MMVKRTQGEAAGPASAPDDGANGIDVNAVEVRFPNGYFGLKRTSLTIPPGAFCTLLGPSGSGKTTLLRVIAGLLTPNSGKISIGNKEVTSLPVQSRNIGFVFQNYALFPHMTVAQNIEYPLKLHKWSQNERRARVTEILELIELPHVAERAVGELSGGQQQRVAIGRALAYRPSLLLLDEPMGALDRRLRQQLGTDLREIQQRTGITTVYVTHDQEEAFILSDKIAIMDGGAILQYDTPAELYFRPKSRFVARFLGEANIIQIADLSGMAGNVPTANTSFGEIPIPAASVRSSNGGALSLVLRPEDLILLDAESAGPEMAPPIPVKIEKELFLGSRCLVTVSKQGGETLLVECAKSHIPPFGSKVWLTWKRDAAVLIDR
ncbi:putative spermidine/putrescine transport system ATP-binding protein [Sinorhizobium fredii]|uniref:Spermidine/putrescine import ATP-binding protein PotA n=1 Tax=Sinorhizobium fredii (strain USDA 257) TaxID=1185652 RepID=I3X376_SINF2|nr:ABC transporter ATP-binding protein [Sinorhizobium fredii]AFL50332.1 spermidine/putrescine import ATP-binding protein PotA [Sinorhizobium fredii USDA 257]